MSDAESTGLDLVTSALSGLPAPVKKSIIKAFTDLLGGLIAIPAAKFRQIAQGIDDTTAARTLLANTLAKAAVEEVGYDPVVMQAAAEVFLPATVRKMKNRIRVAQSAVEHLAQDAAIDPSGDNAAPPNDDWMNNFMRFAEDASSERLQDLFGRILAGEVLRPGAFGLATLRTLSELDPEIANDFLYAWSKSVGSAVDYGAEWQRGDGFTRWKRLSEAGLMADGNTVQFLPDFIPILNGLALWSPMQADGAHVIVTFGQGSTSEWNHIDFTRVGREIGRILPKPNYEENMRQAAHRLPKHGLVHIELAVAGKPREVIWQGAPPN